MSITAPDNRISEYDPVSPTTEFPATFPVFDNDDLIVVHDGVERVDFTVSATYVEGISTNAKAVFAVGIIGNVQVIGRRKSRRTNRFGSGGALPIWTQNLALDTVQAELQELGRDRDRAIKSGYGAEPQDLPNPESGKVLGWSSGGKLTNMLSAGIGDILFGPIGQQLAGTASEDEANDIIGTDTRQTKLHGTGSRARSLTARFGDTVDLREFFDRTGAVGTETLNNVAFTDLIAEINANPQKKTLRGHKGDVYRISGETLRTFAGVGRLMMDGAAFHWTGNLGASNSPLFSFANGWDVEGMEFRVLSGASLRRLLDFTGGDHKLSDIYLWADAQIGNVNALLDYAVRIYRNNNRVRGFKVANIDKAILAYGAGGDGDPGIGNRFDDVEVINYVTGFELRNLLDCRNTGYRCRGRSANGTQDAGHNGLLHSGIGDYVLLAYKIRDAAEHGCRFGGTRNSEQLSRGITVGSGEIIRSGQSGLKFYTGNVGQRFIDVNVSGVNVIDCQYEPENPGEQPGFNDEAFLLQQIVNGTFTGLSASQRDNPTGFSCDCVVYISGANHLLVEGVRGSKPRRNLIRISEFDGGDLDHSVEILDNTSVTVKGASGTDIGADGLYIDHPTKSLRYLNVDMDAVGTNATGFYGVKVNGAAERFEQPSLIQYKVANFQAGAVNAPMAGNPNLIARNVYGSTY